MDLTRSILLPAASSAAKVGFSVGRYFTNLGFKVSRTVTSSAVQLGTAAIDYGLGWSNPSDGLFEGPTSQLGNRAVMLGFESVEWLVGRGIDLGEYMTHSSIEAISSIVESISTLYGDTEEASFSLGAFVQLVRRELANPVDADSLPARRDDELSAKSAIRVAQSLAAWAAIQSMTTDHQERQILSGLKEINVDTWKGSNRPSEGSTPAAAGESQWSSPSDVEPDIQVTSETEDWESHAQITTAEVGHPGDPAVELDTLSKSGTIDARVDVLAGGGGGGGGQPRATEEHPRYSHDRSHLRRMSKITLGSYGGAGLVFFGSPLPGSNAKDTEAVGSSHTQPREEAGAIEAEAIQQKLQISNVASASVSQSAGGPASKAKEWWDTVRGQNDDAIFKHYASLHHDDQVDDAATATATEIEQSNTADTILAERGVDSKKPRFWVLTDHRRREVVLALRGTMSLNELAIDLTCDPVPFSPASTFDGSQGQATSEQPSSRKQRHRVHEGFLKIADQMGGVDGPVAKAVSEALTRNEGYNLVLTGHSLGAGVAALLALMWADPETCLTTAGSTLPPGRTVHAYCFAIPCVTSAALSALSARLITSVVYSYDFVSRLSLGTIRDLKRVSEWLMYAVDEPEEKCNNIVSKAFRIKAGGVGMTDEQKQMESDWFLSLRKTLEANMTCVDLYPAGRIYQAFLASDLSPSKADSNAPVRLFEVTDVTKAYSQIIFASNMLSCHLPHQYDDVLFKHL